MPQAMRSLWPMTIPGANGSEAPEAWRPGAERWHSYHIEGVRIARWGSLASNGRPVALRAPETTQLFDPWLDAGRTAWASKDIRAGWGCLPAWRKGGRVAESGNRSSMA